MGTFSQTSILCDSIETIVDQLSKYYYIGQQTKLDERKEWLYNLPPNNNITVIVSQNHSKNWVEVEFNFDGNLYFYDECLRRISKNLNTKVLLGYYQSSTGDGRVAKFENGNLELSFYERYFYYNPNYNNLPVIDRIYVADNFGIRNTAVEQLKMSKLGVDSNLIDQDFIIDYFKSEGWKADLEKNYFDWSYLHIEQIK
ncbi:hypothetical protein [Nafulsella turpanensis]|uniref:hypothetical protein n=1 Tax=Nafulsella turpanensis TaxID=1265690 RepID=UPI000370B94B|nr:hypothetical protein [Nafulsella turpanensis]